VITLDDVERARERLRPHLPPTPLRRSFAVRDRAVHLKLECWQPTGSFKVRGATAHLAALAADRQTAGVVAASAGNHALGVAFAASVTGGGIPVALFVPENAPRTKLEKLRSFPVTVRLVGATYDDAHAAALEHARRTGASYLHAYDDPLTAAGQGTVGLEILEQLPDVGAIVVPVGGGGLIAGLAVAVKALRTDVRIVAVQPQASPALSESLRRGRPLLDYPARPTLADGLAGGIGEIVFAHRHLIDQVVNVTEAAMEDAIVALLASDQVVAEASGAAGVAALPGIEADRRPVVVVVTGGNIDAPVLARLLASRS
jgi:threonine dehydratase